MNSIRKIFVILLASGGIRIDKINNSRIDALLLIVIGYGSHLLITTYVNFNLAVIYYVSLFAFRYIYLFAGFAKNGFAAKMIMKYGEERAWNTYELQTSFMFFQRGLSFGLLTHASQWSLIDLISTHIIVIDAPEAMILKTVCTGVGLLLVLIGFWVNTASTFIIGIDTYYYKDLFLKRAIVDFKQEGPYKYFANPMYGIGQSSAYGAALMVGSVAGILATLINQAMMYTFYYIIEKPHINIIIKNLSSGKSYPNSIEAKTELFT